MGILELYKRWIAVSDELGQSSIEVDVRSFGVEIGHKDGYNPGPVPSSVIKAVAFANLVAF